MDKKIFVSILKQLSDNYGKEITREQMPTWYLHLGNYEPELLHKAITRIIGTHDYMPTISVIKREINLIQNPVLQLDVDEEWAKAIRNIGAIGRYRKEEYFASLDPFTANIIRQIGFERLCDSTNIEWERKLFIDLFTTKQNSFNKADAINNDCLTFQDIKRIAEKKGYNIELLNGQNEAQNLLEEGEF